MKSTHPNFQTKSIVVDFTKLATIKDYQNAVGDKLRSLDVAVLILNTCLLYPGDLTSLSDQQVQDSIRCNDIHYYYMTKMMLDQLCGRYEKTKRKSGMIFVNSYMSTQVGEANIPFTASKNATQSLAQGLWFEVRK